MGSSLEGDDSPAGAVSGGSSGLVNTQPTLVIVWVLWPRLLHDTVHNEHPDHVLQALQHGDENVQG